MPVLYDSAPWTVVGISRGNYEAELAIVGT